MPVEGAMVGNALLIPLRLLPRSDPLRSPALVRVLDYIRFREPDDVSEFYWFAREYPRAYRYHLEAAQFRLTTIHALLSGCHASLSEVIGRGREKQYAVAISDDRVDRVYWDFESFLSHICVSVDLLTRVIGVAYKEQTAPSFSRFCKKAHPGDALSAILLRARDRWVTRAKDYRDCFVHYAPVDTLLVVSASQTAQGWELRAKLPVNPNAREITRFRFSRRVELLRYAIAVSRHMNALDAAVAHEIRRRYLVRLFPVRRDSLFGVGHRSRPSEATIGHREP